MERVILSFASAPLWAAWLAEHHAHTPDGLWLKIARRESGIPSVTYAEALDEALCFGWIDGQKNKLDERWWLQRFTPRRARSRWSKVNTEKALALIAAGRMQPAGLREVEAAKADGRWERAYDGQSAAQVPPDLQAALEANPRAAQFFATLTGANRYAVLYRIHDAKRPQTRADRIAKFIAMLERGETIHP
ncbi:YdeI/OmpD-associated family protein [Actinocrinis puniceicyclus]|uniref:YdeI/OmpD-associated family protein n=1 Tax=Actinocrinis puniceicyclus TaxID=977794 RepID=A0A8J7WRX3_9ACTN|nr:YdeI/OmpD-associated family protein [Actinocrinis puniceicyclus]MBS2965570.1 YdeI/OmpD-associated family protein [Actinocrinis puniceicyclus]